MSDDLIQSLRDTKYWVPSDEAHSDMQEKCEKAADALAAAQEEIERLREAAEAAEGILNDWLVLATHCSIEEGVCCCGDSMDRHTNPMDCGHSPVDHGAYIAEYLEERTRAALGKEET